LSVKAGIVLASVLAIAAALTAVSSAASPPSAPSPQEVLARSAPSDWREVDPENLLVMELPSGRIVLELAPQFAPLHVAIVKRLARAHEFERSSIVRAQDNYVVQWGIPDDQHQPEGLSPTAPPEFLRPLQRSANFRALQDKDVYAPQVGFIDSWPVARDPARAAEWLTHCYGMLGVGRDTAPDSGSGSELYVVIGGAPRHLDRNVALMGRVVQGIELLSTLPRGTGALGFYEKPEQYVPIRSMTVAADLAPDKRVRFEELRSDTALFGAYLSALRSRRTEWFAEPTDRLEICNAKVPVRPLR
jgi:cyclophilin family peptidyl-prolyl cis-trans isomerase